MPKKIDPEVKARGLRLMEQHAQEYPSLTAAAEAVAKKLGVGKETVRRWAVQAQIDTGQRAGVTSDDSAEIKRLKAENMESVNLPETTCSRRSRLRVCSSVVLWV